VSAAVLPLDAPPGVSGGSRLVQAIEAAYDVLRAAHGELPDVVVCTGSGRSPRGLLWGSHTDAKWRDALADGRVPELFISGECLAQGGAFVLMVICHEAAHALGAVRGIRNCSGQSNRYHNREFLKLAEELGLWFPATEAHPTRGYTDVELTEVSLARYAMVVDALDEALALVIDVPELVATGGPPPGGDGGPVATGGGRKSDRNNMKFECSCEPPRIMRMSPKTWEQAEVTCGACDSLFE
jgi:hypothetical protein